MFAALWLPAVAGAQEGELKLGAQAASRLWVEGGSNVRSWTCHAKQIEASVTGGAVAPTASVKEVSAAASRAVLTVPVAALDCRNGTMNEHMRKALKADANKTIQYRIATWELTPRGDDEGSVTTSGTLVIAGTEKPISVELTAKRAAQGTWQLKGDKTIRMTEWGVKPPSLMFGTMKVHDPVTVGFELVLEPK
ncbi:MAG TPA: YceI family protein [Gemmatimonadaceae bacterium]|nr:YceI family protein [Gemmatimonadaceae bacterium]